MEKYKENQGDRDMLYEEQKREKISKAEDEVRKHKENLNLEQLKIDETKKWKKDHDDNIQKTLNNLVGEITELESDTVESDTVESDTVECHEKNNTLTDDLKNNLDEPDPWLKNKKAPDLN